MTKSVSLIDVAIDTLTAVDRGEYVDTNGATVALKSTARAAIDGTVLHRPDELARFLEAPAKERGAMEIVVTGETTAEAGKRLGADRDVLALNFANARNPGGGFLGGARAQEEDLCRCSALYPCLIAQRDYYVQNAVNGTALYSDHMIYSPKVPFFRDRELRFLSTPHFISVLTVPAPALRDFNLDAPGARAAVAETLDRRIGLILAAAEHHEHDTLVLGAWGCGAFRNDPVQVADLFHKWLTSPRFAKSFRHVCFAVLEDDKKKNLETFKKRFHP